MILCPFCTPHLWYRYKRLVELCIRSYFNFIHKISILLLAASQPYNIVEFLKILKLPSFYFGDFKLFKNALGQFITHRPSKHVITSNGIRTRNHLVCQRAINHLAKLTKWLWALICTVHLTVCSYHATYEFQGKSARYTCAAKVRVFSHAKINVWWYLCKKFKLVDFRLIRETKQKSKTFYNTLMYSTKPCRL